eukprot:CAMPEP_0170373032 /NCGR_PEP_ID=MMETSP0117_2-20130122/9862_1 /TAXON_ID=400756 /ORGANISM="Durinskia baltica, Strain CSIRO CS-38" /LENGTH=91 /DNA_ID=CAMNT_0010627915 /DNA_START=64 /DNA_END=339 /DNA_ORIENTATION=-
MAVKMGMSTAPQKAFPAKSMVWAGVSGGSIRFCIVCDKPCRAKASLGATLRRCFRNHMCEDPTKHGLISVWTLPEWMDKFRSRNVSPAESA